MGGQLGALGKHDAIDVCDLPAGPGHGLAGLLEHVGRVASAVDRIGIGKHLADVAQGGRAQDGVGHGVQQHVGVAVPDEPAVVGDIDAAQPQWAAGSEPVRVVSDSDAEVWRGRDLPKGLRWRASLRGSSSAS